MLRALSYQFVVLMDALSQQKDHCVVTTLAQISSFNAYQNRKEVKYICVIELRMMAVVTEDKVNVCVVSIRKNCMITLR